MAVVSPFLSYSTHENGATNNTLLLAKFIHERGPRRFKAFLDYLIGDEFDVPLGVQFSQQTRQSHSVPDGAIFQTAFKLLIETKLGPSSNVEQLVNHARGMAHEPGLRYLLWLWPEKVPADLLMRAKARIAEVDKTVRFSAVTFESVIEAARIDECCPVHDEELRQRIVEYEDFCNAKQLLKRAGVWMRAVGCGQTIELNQKHRLYFDSCRGFSSHEFVGAYSDKAIRGIGRIDRIVQCDEINGALENLTDSNGAPVTLAEAECNRILAAISDARNECGYAMTERHQYFLFDEWVDMDFPKRSKGPLRGTKFLDLTTYADKAIIESRNTVAIANRLSESSWE